MTKMDKSFMFYLKNWNTMEALSEDDNAELFSQDISGVVKCKDKYDEIVNMADEYFRNVFSKQITERIIDYLESCGLKARAVSHKNQYWLQKIFFDINQDDLKKKKWCLAFYIDNYLEDVCLLAYIVRYHGPTMAVKKHLDNIFAHIPLEESDIYTDCTYLTCNKLETDYKIDIDSDKIIDEITRSIISMIPRQKLNEVVKLS